jgi:hypothetical protein
VKIPAVIVVGAAICTTDCVYQSFADSCQFPSKVPFYDIEPHAFTMFVASPDLSSSNQPFISLADNNDQATLTVRLKESSRSSGEKLNTFLDRCSRNEVREYDLVVDTHDWIAFWDNAEEIGRFSGGIGFPESDSVRAASHGFALVDTTSESEVWTCGCLTD